LTTPEFIELIPLSQWLGREEWNRFCAVVSNSVSRFEGQREELTKANQTIADDCRELTRLSERLASAEESMQAQMVRIEYHAGEAFRFRKERNTANKAVRNLQLTIERTERDQRLCLARANDAIEEKNQEIKDLKEKIRMDQDEMWSLSEKSRYEKEDLEQAKKTLEQQVRELKSLNDEAIRTKAQLETLLAAAKATIDSNESKIRALTEANQRLNRDLTGANTAIQSRDDEIQQLKVRNTRLDEALSTGQATLEGERGERKNLNDVNTSLRTRLTAVDQTITGQAAKISQKTKQLRQKTNEITALKASGDREKLKCCELQEQIRDSEERVAQENWITQHQPGKCDAISVRLLWFVLGMAYLHALH
jgi:chromosome segregation ATPase